MATPKVGSLGEYIRAQRTRAKISLRQLADSAGVSNPYLSQIERGLRKPSAEILQQIAKGLRISAEALYVRAGILEDREADTNVQAAIRADRRLNERQKQVLLDIYESFRRESELAGGSAGDSTGDSAGGSAGGQAGEPAAGMGTTGEAGVAAAGGEPPRRADDDKSNRKDDH